ncbi:MAG: hypothetical protein HQL58_13535, partial [Magnetococcales bacterium]|nr:hypothetical protein [Magnetococcales bacterium]
MIPTPNDPEMQSADLLLENVERLRALFPEAFTEGKIDFAVLKERFWLDHLQRCETFSGTI